jgi:hypothetical protein
LRLIPLALCLTACASKGGGPASSDSGGTSEAMAWQVVSETVADGVLLSAWSDGDTLRMVGGDLGGGAGMMVHGEPGSLCLENDVADRALWWIHGPRPGSWYAVGEAGRVLRSIDGARDRIDVPTDATLFGVWSTDTDVWVAGGYVGSGNNIGEIWHWDGASWTAIATDLPGVLFKVWDNWFVGQDVTYQLVDGDLIDHPVDGRLLTVRGRSEADVWAVGGLTGALVLNWNGSAWTEVDSTGVDQAINGVWTGPGEDVWVAGNYGTAASWDGATWTTPDRPLTTDHLHATWRHGDSTYWVGGDLFNVGDNHGVILRYGPVDLAQEVAVCD